MKRRRVLKWAVGIPAMVGWAYCMAAYGMLIPRLTPDLPLVTGPLRALANGIIPALLLMGAGHLMLLAEASRGLAARGKSRMARSLYWVAVVLSGITLLTDVTLLSEIGKEYLLFDVRPQWRMLYGFGTFHGLVILGGLFWIGGRDRAAGKHPESEEGRDILFVSIHEIAFICGLLGILSALLAISGWVLIPRPYRDSVMLLLAILSVVPLGLILGYWIVRNRRSPLSAWLDEKQMADTAMGALTAMSVVMIEFLVSAVLVQSGAATLSTLFWLCMLFFSSLAVYGAAIMTRNPQER